MRPLPIGFRCLAVNSLRMHAPSLTRRDEKDSQPVRFEFDCNRALILLIDT